MEATLKSLIIIVSAGVITIMARTVAWVIFGGTPRRGKNITHWIEQTNQNTGDLEWHRLVIKRLRKENEEIKKRLAEVVKLAEADCIRIDDLAAELKAQRGETK